MKGEYVVGRVFASLHPQALRHDYSLTSAWRFTLLLAGEPGDEATASKVETSKGLEVNKATKLSTLYSNLVI